MSRPAKPPMTDDEYDLAVTMLMEQRRGCGLRAVAEAISRRRGATTLSRSRNVRKGVSEWWVRQQLQRREREETTGARKPASASENDPARGNEVDVDGRRTIHQTTAPEGTLPASRDRKTMPEGRFAATEGERRLARTGVEEDSQGGDAT